MDLSLEAKLYILGVISILMGVFLLYGIPITLICGGVLTIVFSLLITLTYFMYIYADKR